MLQVFSERAIHYQTSAPLLNFAYVFVGVVCNHRLDCHLPSSEKLAKSVHVLFVSHVELMLVVSYDVYLEKVV